jgi:hypothetical protein
VGRCPAGWPRSHSAPGPGEVLAGRGRPAGRRF